MFPFAQDNLGAIDTMIEKLKEIRGDSHTEDIYSLCLEVADYLGRMDRSYEDNDYAIRLRPVAGGENE